MTTTTVVYHSADYDGIFCREIARHFLGEEGVQFIGWNFGDPKVPMPPEGDVFVLDLSPDCLEPQPDCKDPRTIFERIVWIDHHKTAIDKWGKFNLRGFRIDGVSACRLAWQYFMIAPFRRALPSKEEFVTRTVLEPLSVQLAGEYDIHDERNPDAQMLQYGLRCVDEGADFWEALLHCGDVGVKAVEDLLGHGRIAQKYAQKIDASMVRNRSFLMKWEGLTWLCINTGRFNSLTFLAKDVPETGHDALLGFAWTGKVWMVSMYHARHRTDLDLSEIAKRQPGGGGHKGACGFTCSTLPFPLL